MVIAVDSWHWQSIDDSVIHMMPSSRTEYQQLLADYDLCLTGQVSVRHTCAVIYSVSSCAFV